MPKYRHSREAVVLDSNLLLLLVIGAWNPRAIALQKRLGGLTFGDFLLLTDYLGSYRRIVTTAHILTEVSNLAGAASGATKDAIFAQLIHTVGVLQERQMPAALLVKQPELRPFGLTDAAISLLCAEFPVVTLDGRLAGHLQRRGLPAITLDHIRKMRDESNRS